MSDPPQADAPETPVPVPAVPPRNGGDVPGVEVALLRAELAASRRREAWLTAAADVITLMLLAEDPREVLTLVAERAREAAGADNCSLVLQQEDGGWQLAVSTGVLADAIRGQRVEPHVLSVDVALTGRTLLMNDPDNVRGRLAPPFRKFGALVYAPLAPREDRPLGTLVLAHRKGGRAFDDEDARLATAFANQAGLALALTEARAAEDRLAVYADRERIARDLHDLTIQRLFAAGLTLQVARQRIGAGDPDAAAAAERLDTVIDELDAAIAEIRTTIFGLHLSPEQEAASVRARVLREASNAARVLGFEPAVRFQGPVDSTVGEAVGAHLVAAVRESLANAAKHAGASRVDVEVAVERTAGGRRRELRLEVRDDGETPLEAWQPSPARTATTRGLANLAARAAELGGRFDAGPGARGVGTRLRWRVPV